ncbi:hypothetical protein HDU83_002027 [Entophlyctis luteolus]|nr:hypothetical protein HDU83_002027 [Entophlyctis luteolus]
MSRPANISLSVVPFGPTRLHTASSPAVLHHQSTHPSVGRGGTGKTGQMFTPDPKNTSLPPIPLRPDGRRKRVHPTRGQQALLEAFFAENRKPNPKERAEICSAVNINSKSVQIWFQNRRAKAKKSGNASAETLSLDIPRASSCSPNPSGDVGFEETGDNRNSASFSNDSTPGYAGQFSNTQTEMINGLNQPRMLWTTANGSTRIFASELNIGSWRRIATTPHDLLRWAVVEAAFTFAMEISLASVLDVSINLSPSNDIMSVVTIDLGSAPMFYRELRDNHESPTGIFVHCNDFTENTAASHCFRHTLQGLSVEMEKLFLLLSQYFNAAVAANTPPPAQPQLPHLHQHSELSKQGYSVHESMWFEPQRSEG